MALPRVVYTEYMHWGEGRTELLPLVAAAHELKAPLALVRQLALHLQDTSLSPAHREELLQRVVLTTERGLRVTSDLTKASRLDDALFRLEPINSEQLCTDVARELQPLFAAYGKAVRVQTRRHPLLLVANRDLLRRIVLGFSDNALKYSQASPVVELQIKALKKAGYVRVGVRDYGPALSSDMWRVLQKNLGTTRQPLHARPESSGLGLYIAARFAEAMHGKIGAIRHRQGATFYVDLQASTQTSLL